MEYLAAIFGLGIMCGCALGAYALLDTIDREQEQDHARAAERAPRHDGAAPLPLRVAALRPPIRFEYPLSSDRGRPRHERPRQGASVAAYADWLEARVRGLEDQLDQLVRDSLRVEALALRNGDRL